MIRVLYLALLGACLSGCCGSDDSVSDIAIKREIPGSVFIEHEDGTVTRTFLIDRPSIERLAFSQSSGSPPDPFAPSSADQTWKSGENWPVRKVFENLKVPFPDGTDATYDLSQMILTVRHQPEWIDFIQAALESVESSEKMINVRIEIFEVPKALAFRLEQSAGKHSDHLPEWEALQKVIKEEKASLVTTCNVRSRPGQRASYSDGEEVLLFSEFEWDKTIDPPIPVPRFESRTVGTIVEVDPILGPDDFTIDLNFSLEHHTAPPEMAPMEVPVPGKAEPVAVEAPVFHTKTLVTQITIFDGGTRLLCSWQPTGLPEFAQGDRMRIAFLKVDVQRVAGGYTLPPATH